MAEYIDRDKLIREGWSLQRTYKMDATTLVCEMKKPEDFPPADVRPVVRGKWEEVEVTWLADVEDQPDAIASMLCSECRRFANHVYHYGNPRDGMNFCPHCGAWMGGDAE